MDRIIFYVQKIGEFFTDLIEHLDEGFEIILSFLTFPYGVSQYLPPLFVSAMYATIAIGIVKFILGR